MENEKRIPVHIITGFLGSGKTTFLNEFIRSQKGRNRIVVIENEVGKVNIDGALVVEGVEEVMELTAGCLCCNLNEKLYELLIDLENCRAKFDILLIETTGIADPSGVLETFWSHGFIESNFEVKNTICLADAQYMRESIEQTDEARRQIAFADVVLLNKCDMVSPTEADGLQVLIEDINPSVKVHQGSEGRFPNEEILNLLAHDAKRVERQNQAISPNYEHRHKGINTFTLLFDTPFDFAELRFRLMVLLEVNKQQIYRIKGIVDVAGMDERIIIQSVYRSYRVEESRPWAEGEVRQSKIVFIGKGVEKASMERIFNQCLDHKAGAERETTPSVF